MLSTGMLRQDVSGQWTILLLVAPGTIDAPVGDLSGNLVASPRAAGCGGATANFTVKVVPPGKLVLDLVKFAEGGSDQQAQDADPRGILSRVKYE